MEIIDYHGKKITITNLEKAIQQAQLFKDFEHTDPQYRQGDQERKLYWTDMYKKLQAVQKTSKKCR